MTTSSTNCPNSINDSTFFFVLGCKIKALRAKTNTYIKTPVRGEEPVFVVTGRKEDVGLAKREILSAAEHFSQIRASRKNNINSTLAFGQIVANTEPFFAGWLHRCPSNRVLATAAEASERHPGLTVITLSFTPHALQYALTATKRVWKYLLTLVVNYETVRVPKSKRTQER